MALIPILGIPSNWYVPGAYVEILPAQGPSSASAAVRDIVFVCPKLAASGSWVANTRYQVKNEAEAITGAGAGSPLHRALRASLARNKTAKHWAVPYLPTSGGGAAAATSTVTYTTDPTGTGTTRVYVCGEECSFTFADADTTITIATGMAASINTKTWLPVTAANGGTAVVTLTAKIAGVSQGDGTTSAIKVRAEIDAGIGTTVATTGGLGVGAGVDGAEGATTELTNLTTALATLDAVRHYYIVTTAWAATSLAALALHIATKSEPRRGLRSVGIAAFTGALAAAQSLATARNYERLSIIWQPQSEVDPATLAGAAAAIFQKYEEVDACKNFDGYRGVDWGIPAVFEPSNWPDGDDLNDAITDGLTPIQSDDNGSYIVMAITTRSKDSTGAVDDFRATERHRVSGCDQFADTLLIRDRLMYSGKKLKNDQFLSNGKPNPNQKRLPGVITPSSYKPFVMGLVDEFENAAILQDGAATKEGMRCVIDPGNSGRLELGMDLRTIDLLHQKTYRIAEVSPG